MKHSRILVQIVCFLIFAVSPGQCWFFENSAITDDSLHDIELQVQQEVNDARLSAHIPQLVWNENLAVEARRHARNMAARQFFSHQDPTRGDISRRLDKSGIDWMRCAENLYSEKGFNNPAREAVKTWLDSPGHRRNMLDSMMSEAGVGAALKSDGTLLIVQVYILD